MASQTKEFTQLESRATNDEYLTARDVADRYGVRPKTVLGWTRSGKLPGIRLPSGALRYRASDLEGCEQQLWATPCQEIVSPTSSVDAARKVHYLVSPTSEREG